MSRLRARNDIDLLLPHDPGVVFKIRRIHELPDDYEALEYLQERTDQMNPKRRTGSRGLGSRSPEQLC